MSPEEQRKQIKALNAEISKMYEKLRIQEIPPMFDVNQLEAAKRLYSDLNNEITDITGGLQSISGILKGNLDELGQTNVYLNSAKNSIRSLSKGTQELAYENQQDNIITEKKLAQLRKRAVLDKQSLSLAISNGDFNESERKAAVSSVTEAENYLTALDAIGTKAEELRQNSGVQLFGGLEELSGTLGLGKFSSVFKDASTAAQITAKAGGTGTEALLSGFEAMGPAIKKSLGPLALIAMAVDALKSADKAVGDMAKGMNMTYQDALAMKKEMTAAANASGNIFVTSAKLSETLVSINASLGTSVQLNDKLLVQFTEMREMAGFTNEELQGIANLSLTTGENMDSITGEFMAQAKMSALQNGVILNTKQLTKEIKDISAATTLSFAKNPKLLAQAVATTKSLGMEMSQVEGIANSLLDFESSISNELQAEVLLNKDLNLSKARQAAMNNDLATLAQEISSQMGSAAEFSELNNFQQNALAKAVGMSREELAKTLYIQEQLSGATGKQAEEERALMEARIAEVGLAQTQAELAKDGVKGLRDQASMADRLNAVMEKLQEVFVSLVEPLMPVLDIFMSIAKIVGELMKVVGPLLKITTSIGSLGILDLVSGKSAFSGVSEGFSELGNLFTADDAIMPSGYGDTIIKKGKGTIALNNNDSVVAGTNLGGRSDMKETNQTNLGGGSDMKETNQLLKMLVTQNNNKPEISPVGLYQVQ